jgi:hypothetical protein
VDACTQLAALVAALRSGCVRPLPLFAKASWDALKRWRIRDGEADFAEFIEKFCDLAGQDDNERAAQNEFTQTATRIAWRGVNLAAPDAALQRQLYANATSLFPAFAPPAARPKR